jgi:glycine/D-amino acid oxidase-like deaminating enzyme
MSARTRSDRTARRNGGISYWYREAGIAPPRAPLPGDISADYCIVGAGFTGLWTAWYLKHARPEAEVVVLEREFAGFGASGRNGGWLSDHFAGSREEMASSHGRDSVLLLQRELQRTIDEVIEICAAEGIEADIVKDGVLTVARSVAQQTRLDEQLAQERAWELGPEDSAPLTAAQLEERVRISGARGATFSPHCARVQPAKLVTGLAAAVERLGVTIYENTVVRAIGGGQARTDRGTVRAPVVLRCLEGFTPSLEGERRALLPLNSAMIVTDPLGDARWDQIGWDGAELIGDFAHAYMYAQRTADGRIAIGGRGVPYRFGSRTDHWGITQGRTIASIETILHAMFPATAGVAIDQAWCGVLGVSRDWTPTVAFDRETGTGSAGGYVGSGVTATNLAARVLTELVLERESELTTLPWVRTSAPQWEPEPLRFIGANLVYGLYRGADRRESESDTARDDPRARLADLISGR